MALRTIRLEGDEILAKKCRPVKEMTERISQMIDDMFETMYDAQGVGLAAPQIGVLRQVFVVDIGDGQKYVFVNPEITERSEETRCQAEACLSVPGKQGLVTRSVKIRIKAFDQQMQPFELEAEDFLAKAIQHEFDHLQGVLYTGIADHMFTEEEMEELARKAAEAEKEEEASAGDSEDPREPESEEEVPARNDEA